jgi:hypothetical protein
MLIPALLPRRLVTRLCKEYPRGLLRLLPIEHRQAVSVQRVVHVAEGLSKALASHGLAPAGLPRATTTGEPTQ